MAESIQISTQALIDTAKKVRDINEILDTKLAEINSCMNELDTTWKSDAGFEIREAMNALKPRFEQYKSVVNSYAMFLDNTAQSYENTETALHTNASAFK